jgi:hypothetical protein
MKELTVYHNEVKLAMDNPQRLAEIGIEASAEYMYYSEVMFRLQVEKSKFIVEEKFKGEKPLSDAHCERLWQQTENGIKEMKLKYYMKALEKVMAMVKNNNYIQNVEANNQI